MTQAILDEADAGTLLHKLHKCASPVLTCLCGRSADLRDRPDAWNGWQVLPFAKCPECLKVPAVESVFKIQIGNASERIKQLIKGTRSHGR